MTSQTYLPPHKSTRAAQAAITSAISFPARDKASLSASDVLEAGALLVSLPPDESAGTVVVVGPSVMLEVAELVEVVDTAELFMLAVFDTALDDVAVKFPSFSIPAVMGTAIAVGRSTPSRTAVLIPGFTALLPVAVPTHIA